MNERGMMLSMLRWRKKPTPVLDEYRAEHPPDEILFYLGVRLSANGGMSMERRGTWENFREIHHIFAGQHRRRDLLSNLIGVNSEGHDGRHRGIRGEAAPYTCLCLLAKWRKSLQIGNYMEFHHDDLVDAAGHLILPYIDFVSFEDEWLENERRKLESLVRSIESE